jgi:hypothetical protein
MSACGATGFEGGAQGEKPSHDLVQPQCHWARQLRAGALQANSGDRGQTHIRSRNDLLLVATYDPCRPRNLDLAVESVNEQYGDLHKVAAVRDRIIVAVG